MGEEKYGGKIPKRKLPNFRIRDSQIRDMKAAAEILDMLAEKPEVLRSIVDEFGKVAEASEEDVVAVSYEAKQSMIDILACNLKDLPEDVIEKNMATIWQYTPIIWYIPHIWIIWGPWIVAPPWVYAETRNLDEEGQIPEELRRRYKW